MESQRDLLTETELTRTPVTPGVRLANYIVDAIVFYVVMFIVGYAGAGMINSGNPGPIYLLSLTIIIAYYTILEGVTGGKTIGKFVTRTRAIREDGGVLTLKDAFLRTLCRLIPFEPLSIFFGANRRMWHDSMTKTLVVKE